MPGLLTRKTRTPRGKLASSSAATSDITNFTKLSKQKPSGKDAPVKAQSIQDIPTTNIEVVLQPLKRKAEDAVQSTPKKLRQEPATPVSGRKKTVEFADKATPVRAPKLASPTPSSSRKRRSGDEETTDTEALLERLQLQSPVRKRTKNADTKTNLHNDFDLPQELIDLLDLHVAFLKTLSMQCVHQGMDSPIDLRTIYPSVTRTWGKRQVTLEDIQRLVGVLGWTQTKTSSTQHRTPYFLADFGRGKICIEFHADAERGPLREHKLNMDFEANLRALWQNRRDQPVTLFLGTLPKASIKACAAHIASTKTQTTLDAFKASIAAKRAEQEKEKKATNVLPTPAPSPAPSQPDTPVQQQPKQQPQFPEQKLSLLDRIRAKSLAASQQAEPTPAELQRRVALRRAADVAAVIGMLSKASTSAGQARVSFTMAHVQARLRDSLRASPMSVDDAAASVRLLATEVAPQWLRIVTLGGRENVVISVAMQPTKGQVEERARQLLGE